MSERRRRRSRGREKSRERASSQGGGRKEHGTAGRVLSGLGIVLLVLVILLCIPITVPRVFGVQVYNVISGSMEPAIPTGSLVYVKSVQPSQVEADDVIAFYSSVDSGAVTTHRVVENHTVSGEFITKGDANEENDPLPVDYDYLLGKVILNVPILGELLAMAATLYGKIAMACMIGAAVIFLAIGSRV